MCFGVEKNLREVSFRTFGVIFEVVPWRRGGNHVLTQRVGARLFDCVEWVDGVSFAFRHFFTLFVEYKSVGYYGFEGRMIEGHCTDSVESEEPATSLVYALGNKVGGNRRPLSRPSLFSKG